LSFLGDKKTAIYIQLDSESQPLLFWSVV